MKFLLIAASLTVAATGARAQSDGTSGQWAQTFGNQDIDVSVGAFQPTARFGVAAGDKSQTFGETGYLFTLDYFHDVLPWAALGLEGAYIMRGQHDIMHTASSYDVTTGAPLNTTTKVNGDSQTGMLVFRLRPRNPGWRPYAIGGFGVAHTHMEINDMDPPGYHWIYNGSPALPIAIGDSMALAWTARTGIEYAYADGGQLGLEAGYWRLSPHSYPVRSGTPYAATVPYVVSSGDGLSLALKCSIRFGGPRF